MEDKATVFSVNIISVVHSNISLSFIQSKPHCVWLDWGDGSQRDSFAEAGLIETSHTYAEPGEYQIMMFAVDDGKIEIVSFCGDNDGYKNMLEQLTVSEDVTAIHDGVFKNCENLESLAFLGENAPQLGEYAFASCGSITEVAIPGSLAILPVGAFFNCSGLKTVELSESVSVISANAFQGCTQIKTINLDNVEKFEAYAFQGCRKLTGTNLEKATHITEGAFDSCNNIRNLKLDNVEYIGDRVFCNCKSLVNVEIGESIKEIGEGAFQNCSFAKEIKIAARKAPVLHGMHAFDGDGGFIIKVPRDCKSNYINETNWTVFADKMEEGL